MLIKIFRRNLTHHQPMALKCLSIFFLSDTFWFYGLLDSTVTTTFVVWDNHVCSTSKLWKIVNNTKSVREETKFIFFQIGLSNFYRIYFRWSLFYKSWFTFNLILAWGWIIELFYQLCVIATFNDCLNNFIWKRGGS